MLDLAAHARDGRLRLDRHGRMSDDEVIAEVTKVHGVGPWTTQMYLMHTLGRRDVWPVGDFGVRYGWSLLHDLDEMITEKELRGRGDTFAGMRSDVAWYCWRAVHFERSSR
jgi:DNA-3-methyladenine glycosylase II